VFGEQIFRTMMTDADTDAANWCQTQPDCEFDRSVCVNHDGSPSEHCVFPGTYALIGAASMLGGVTRMTVSLTVILLETTQDIQYLLPIMTVLIVSKWVGDAFNISLYDMHVEFKCIPFVEDLPPTGMEHLVAADVMSTNVVTFAEIEPAHEVYARLCSCKHNGFPVVSNADKISGTILRSHLVKVLKMGAFCSAEGLPIEGSQQLSHDDLAVTLESEIEDVTELSESAFDGGKYMSRDSSIIPAFC
jgi:CBS domain-containing protein